MENTTNTIVGFSGGKDSTAMVLEMAARGEEFKCLFTATGNELPGVMDHLRRVVDMAGRELIELPAPTLTELMEKWNAVPNFRQRWCTRAIKIVPCAAYLKNHPGSTLCVGLRADEMLRVGLYGDFAEYRYPLRDWGWGLEEVQDYCRCRGAVPPARTDCAWCFYQRLGEWWELSRTYPELYQQAVDYEEAIGHTFRTPGKDTWPTALRDLRAEFETGRKVRGLNLQGELFAAGEFPDDGGSCRVCRL